MTHPPVCSRLSSRRPAHPIAGSYEAGSPSLMQQPCSTPARVALSQEACEHPWHPQNR